MKKTFNFLKVSNICSNHLSELCLLYLKKTLNYLNYFQFFLESGISSIWHFYFQFIPLKIFKFFNPFHYFYILTFVIIIFR